jgi:hypothetical protein
MKPQWLQKALLGAFTVIALYAQSPAANGPGERVVEFLPSDTEILTKGTTVKVSAVVALFPSRTETVRYFGNITINGRRRRYDGTFVNVLTPLTAGSAESLNETQSWFVHVTGPKTMRIRLQLTATGESSGASFRFADLMRTYSVKCNQQTFVLLRLIEHFLGCCS